MKLIAILKSSLNVEKRFYLKPLTYKYPSRLPLLMLLLKFAHFMWLREHENMHKCTFSHDITW